MSSERFNPSTPFAVVVNDDPAQLNVLSGLVRKASLEPRAFTAAEAALADMSAWAATADRDPGALPALVLTDLYMPGLDGWRFCRLLRSPEYAAFNQVPILVVSATFAGDEADRIAADLGAEAFLSSPVDGKRFVEQVRAILSGERMRPPLRVLIVEDSKTQSGIITEAFEAHGYQADTALTAREAAEAFARTAYDVAVLDYHLPDGRGDSLLDAFRTQRPDCVCLMMTTDPGPDLALGWMKRGAAAYLQKPFQPDYLIELCARARRERALLRVQDLLEVRTRELRQSEEKHRILLEESSDPIFSFTPEGHYTYVNRAFSEGVGKPVEDITGKSIWDVFPKEEADKRFAALNQVFRTGEEQLTEVRVPRADGDRYFMTTISPIKNRAGEVVSAICSSKDITERKQAEDALRASQQIIESIINAIPVRVFWKDKNLVFLGCNAAFARDAGFDDPKDIIGKDDYQMMWRDQAELYRGDDRQVIESGCSRLFIEEPQTTPEGNTITLLTSKIPLRNFSGEISGVLGTYMDITARKQAEEEANRLASVVRHSRELINLATPDGTMVFLNDAGKKMLGISEEDLAQTNIMQVIPEPLRDKIRQELMPALVGDGFWEGDLRYLNLETGGLTDVHAITFRIVDPETGALRFLANVSLDITERKRAEDALRRSEEKYRALFESSRDALMTLAPPSWSFTSGNPATVDMFRAKNEEEFTSYAPWALSAERQPDGRASAEKAKEMIETAIREGSHFFDWRHKRIDGEEFPATVLLTRVEQGGKVFLEATIRDITERKRADDALRTEKERFQTFSEEAPFGMVTIEQDGTFGYINSKFKELFGYELTDVPDGKTWFRKAYPDPAYRHHVVETWIKDLEKFKRGEKRSEVFAVTCKDGTEKIINFIPVQLATGENLMACEDITERKRAEEEKAKLEGQLLQAQKMESVGRLAGGVAHDFNNMLGVILGHAEIALEQVDPSDPVHADLEEIRKAAERSADLTRQLLAFARKQTVAPRVLDLNETVEGMLKMLERLIGEDVHLTWQLKADLWPVKVDPSQIDQILTNLCVNARDAIADVGKITIETGNSTLDEAYCVDHPGCVPGEYALLAVSDDGCGMDKETLSHLFEPFFTTKGIGKGAGLGLATVYGAVKQNNGFINACSESGQGTTFTIYLPRHVGKAEQARTGGAAGPFMRGQETILLAEDEPANLKLIMMMLEKQGYTVLAASTPGEAIRLAREHGGEIHLLMTDVVMPEMNGRDLARTLLSLYPRLKRLFMSGYTSDVIAHHGVLDEGVYFIQKPFSRNDLAAKVREALDSE